VEHVFSCPAKPTALTPIDLWLKPREVAVFLGLIDEEAGQGTIQN
jgi:hypothetical protein